MDEAYEHLNPAQALVSHRVKRITDEVADNLQDLDFIEADDWTRAFDIAERFIRWSILCDVNQGNWVEAGIHDIHQLDDLKVVVKRGDPGVRMIITMPNVMRILREQDDPNAN